MNKTKETAKLIPCTELVFIFAVYVNKTFKKLQRTL